MIKIKKFQKADIVNSGFACLKMITDHLGYNYTMESLKHDYLIYKPHRLGTELRDLGVIAECIDLEALWVSQRFFQLIEGITPPVIIPWKEKEHFVVFCGSKASFWSFLPWVNKEKKLIIADPTIGMRKVDRRTLYDNWMEKDEAYALVLVIREQTGSGSNCFDASVKVKL